MINILGKLVDGALSYAPRKIIIDGKTIFNPEEELLKEQGYKDVETAEAPEVSTQTQQAVPSWTEQEDKIVQTWELKPAQPDPTAAIQEIQTQAVLAQIAESEDKTLGIQCMALFPVYEQNKYHDVGEVAGDGAHDERADVHEAADDAHEGRGRAERTREARDDRGREHGAAQIEEARRQHDARVARKPAAMPNRFSLTHLDHLPLSLPGRPMRDGQAP